jgi:hypothetical protein
MGQFFIQPEMGGEGALADARLAQDEQEGRRVGPSQPSADFFYQPLTAGEALPPAPGEVAKVL